MVIDEFTKHFELHEVEDMNPKKTDQTEKEEEKKALRMSQVCKDYLAKGAK
ncbi:hypothetical protein GCM10020331_022860 [Ectobacillus funiculus]